RGGSVRSVKPTSGLLRFVRGDGRGGVVRFVRGNRGRVAGGDRGALRFVRGNRHGGALRFVRGNRHGGGLRFVRATRRRRGLRFVRGGVLSHHRLRPVRSGKLRRHRPAMFPERRRTKLVSGSFGDGTTVITYLAGNKRLVENWLRSVVAPWPELGS